MACWMNPQMDDETCTTVKNLRPEKLDDFMNLIFREIFWTRQESERKRKHMLIKNNFQLCEPHFHEIGDTILNQNQLKLFS